MGTEVFNRYEKKFIINQDMYDILISRLSQKMTLDAYNHDNGFYTISNIYFDTPQNELIKKSLEKPLYKEKLRLRSYGVPSENDIAYLEIKKKYNGLVNKRRTEMAIADAYTFVETGKMPEIESYHNEQVKHEIEFIVNRYHLRPSMYIAYDRKAMFCEDLRITFDTNIRTRQNDLKLEKGDYGDALLNENQWLLEVKAQDALPLWFTKILSELKIMPTSFSKYGNAYMKSVKGETRICLKPYLAAHQVVQSH